MPDQRTAATDKVTVMVFKDNYAARTFQVPLSWISRLGLILGALGLITFYSVFLSVKYYRVSRAADPTRLHDLELEIERLRVSYQLALDSANNAGKNIAPPPSVAVADNTGAKTTSQGMTAEVPGKSANKDSAPISEPDDSDVSTPVTPIRIPKVVAAAKPTTPALPDRASLSIVISTPIVSWKNETLHVDFNIQYISADGRNQQGHIVVVAAGPDRMLSYPSGVVNPPGSEEMLAPERGEYFSVSHFREVNAELSGIRSPDSIKNVEIRIYDHDRRLVILEKVDLEKHPISVKDDSE